MRAGMCPPSTVNIVMSSRMLLTPSFEEMEATLGRVEAWNSIFQLLYSSIMTRIRLTGLVENAERCACPVRGDMGSRPRTHHFNVTQLRKLERKKDIFLWWRRIGDAGLPSSLL